MTHIEYMKAIYCAVHGVSAESIADAGAADTRIKDIESDMERITERGREVLEQVYRYGLSNGEAAKVLKTTLSSVTTGVETHLRNLRVYADCRKKYDGVVFSARLYNVLNWAGINSIDGILAKTTYDYRDNVKSMGSVNLAELYATMEAHGYVDWVAERRIELKKYEKAIYYRSRQFRESGMLDREHELRLYNAAIKHIQPQIFIEGACFMLDLIGGETTGFIGEALNILNGSENDLKALRKLGTDYFNLKDTSNE